MVEKEIKRHHIFLIVFGIMLGFADPITHILTLVEFYREIGENHKTWFGVWLTFVVLPCFAFLLTYYVLKKSELKKVSIARRCRQVILSILSSLSKTANTVFLPEEFYEFLAWQ